MLAGWVVIGAGCSVAQIHAGVIAQDSFNYLAGGGGSLHGKNGGTGWSGGWVTNGLGNTVIIADATTAELAFAPEGGELIDGGVETVEIFGTVNQPVASRQLASPQTGTFYVAYLVRFVTGSWTDTDTFSLHLANHGGNTSTLNFGMRGDNNANGNHFMVRTGTGAPLAGDSFGGTVVLNTTHLLVARVSKPGGSGTFDQIDVWLNPGLNDADSPAATFNEATGAGLAGISHVVLRAAALESADRVRVDELKLATEWTDIIVPAPMVPRVSSFSLMQPGNAGPVPGYDPLTNGAVFNLFVTGTNLNVRANTAPAADFGSLMWTLTGATTHDQIENDPPWALFGDASGNYNSGQFNLGVHSLTATPYDGNGGAGGGGTAGHPLTIGFSVTNFVVISVLSTNTNAVVGGELKKWHRVTLTWEGPNTSETATPNPFRDYRLNVRFIHPGSGRSYQVPGFFAADGDAANTSADSGNKWRVHFAPDETGTWSYVASFRAGSDVATDPSLTAGTATDFDGASGTFIIGPTDKTGRDFRGQGRLQYVGRHHLRFAETGGYFLKCGADSPENIFAYDDFDDTPNTGNRRKSWYGHTNDYDAVDAAGFTWQNGKGKALLGAIKYLADEEGMNAFSFLTFNIDGDDDNVFPHRLASTVAAYQAVTDNQRWNSGTVYKDRFDVSKMAQWDLIFAYGTKQGMYLHFKTLETENELRMDGGNQGVERSLYYRELIARFGYHPALNWNLGEEIDNATTAQKQSWSQYFHDHDPYRHHQVIHNGANHYDLLGNASKLTGFSLQTSRADFAEVHSSTKNYIDRSVAAGKPWVVACDEPGDASLALVPDSDIATYDSERNHSRKNALWGHLLAGGAGLEWYFGYNRAHSDLTCEDWRSRDQFWDLCRHALEFFRNNHVPFWDMTNHNALLTTTNGWCLSKPNAAYVVFLKSAETTSLRLTNVTGDFSVQWFDPRKGGALQSGTVTQLAGGTTVSLGAPPESSTNDWVGWVKRIVADTNAPSVIIHSPPEGASWPGNLPVTISASVTDDVAVASVQLWVDGILQTPTLTNAPYDFSVAGLTLGEHWIAVAGEDPAGNRATNSVVVKVIVPAAPPLSLVASGGGWQLAWTTPGFVLDHALAVAGPWTNVLPPGLSPFPLRPTNAQEYFRLRWEGR